MQHVPAFEKLIAEIPDFAKDIRLNASSIISTDGAPGLSEKQILGTALACAYAVRSPRIAQALVAQASGTLTGSEQAAARTAAALMAMTNVYYRAIHLAADADLAKSPARLRMNAMANPGTAKVDFELFSLGASAISGCEMCIRSHIKQARDAGILTEGIQSVLRIAAVVNAAAISLSMSDDKFS